MPPRRILPLVKPLGDMTPETFMRRHWQKKPLFIKGGLPGVGRCLSPDELAGLALEEGVESRLVLEKGGVKPWMVEHGPFSDARLRNLPPKYWSLLVQGVERLVPDVAALLAGFRFLPRWRLDDIMVSYAPDGGSVGAHVDNYDVFLIQGRGRRRWLVGESLRETATPERAGLDLRILPKMRVTAEYLCEEGDILYLPPRWAHHGIAVGEAMTYSVGFRAATYREMLTSYCASLLDDLEIGGRYSDPELGPAADAALLPETVVTKVRQAMQQVLEDDEALRRWLGTFLTEARQSVDVARKKALSRKALEEKLASAYDLAQVPGTRWAYVAPPKGQVRVFVEGEMFACQGLTAAQAKFLTNSPVFGLAQWQPRWQGSQAFMAVVTALVNAGHLQLQRRKA